MREDELLIELIRLMGGFNPCTNPRAKILFLCRSMRISGMPLRRGVRGGRDNQRALLQMRGHL